MTARPRRVLVVSHLALPHVGGVENLVDLEVRALAADGHEVTLLTSDGGGAGRTPDYPPTVRTVRILAWHILENRFRVPYPIFGPRLLGELWRWLGWCDVLHAHGFMFQSAALAVWLAKLRGKPSLLTDHGGFQKYSTPLVTAAARLGGETVGRLTVLLASKVLTYNSRVQAQLAHLRRRHDVAFLANPIDRTLFRPPTHAERAAARVKLGWPEGRAKVLFVGRLIPAKGVPLLLDSLHPEYDVAFCGPGDPSILGTPLKVGVEYLPPRPQAELIELYHAADALALPADVREGFPLVVQEAVACGVPVVLGYDPGFEPYRSLPGLRFCTLTPESVRGELLAAVRSPRPTGDAAGADLFPPSDVWVRKLLALIPANALAQPR